MTQLALAPRDAGIRESAVHAEDLEPGWSASTYRLLGDYARGRAEFTSEAFRDHLSSIGFPVGFRYQQGAASVAVSVVERELAALVLWIGTFVLVSSLAVAVWMGR